MVQSCFAEMLCDFCSYELKNRYENSGGMNNIKDQHAGFVIASLEKENTTTLFFCTILKDNFFLSNDIVIVCSDIFAIFAYINLWSKSIIF